MANPLRGRSISRSLLMGPDLTCHIIARAGLEIGGTCAFRDTPPHWKPYFGVTSAKTAVDAVTSAGGTFTVQIKDTQGIPLALVGPA